MVAVRCRHIGQSAGMAERSCYRRLDIRLVCAYATKSPAQEDRRGKSKGCLQAAREAG
jgi:hypothetical protein